MHDADPIPAAPRPVANDNAPPAAHLIPVVGYVGDDGRVRFNAAWTARAFPNDHREA